jgi:hypothetical protein
MAVTRYDNYNAPHNQKANALTEALESPGLKKVLLFWSPKEGGSPTDGPSKNFPMLSALVEMTGEGDEPEYKVFDGFF